LHHTTILYSNTKNLAIHTIFQLYAQKSGSNGAKITIAAKQLWKASTYFCENHVEIFFDNKFVPCLPRVFQAQKQQID
jgi:hypothetical protein